MRITLTPGWVVFFACIGVIFGIACASISVLFGGIGGIAAIIASCIFLRSIPQRDRLTLCFIFLFGMSIGFFRYEIAGPGWRSIAHRVGQSVIVEGRVVEKDVNDAGVVHVLDSLSVEGRVYDDRIRLEAPISSNARIGDRLRTACVLEQPRPFDGFAYDRFLAAQSIYAICESETAPFVLNRGHDYFFETIGFLHDAMSVRARSILPEPQATLLLGLLIGENDFSRVWKEKFRLTGTSHIVAASGYNIAVVAQIVLVILVSCGLYRKQAYPIVVAAIVLFACVAGTGGAVLRAATMGVLALTARHIGRTTTMRNVVAITVVILLMIEPRLLRDDVGFQLSVMATIGLILGTDRISAICSFIPTSFGLRESFASTIAATIATLPITMISFGQISIVAPLVNIMILPWIPYAMILGVIAIVISMFLHAPFSIFFALPAWTVLVTMTSIIDWWSKIPFVSLPVDARVSVVVCVIVFGTLARMFRRLPRSFERNLDAFDVRRVCIIGVVLFVLCSIHLGVIAWRSGRFTSASTLIFVFDVGQGDAMLIDGSTRDIIIDGGSTRFGLLEAMALVRFPWERHVDVVIATHPHADHVVGLLELIARYDINEIVKNGSMYDIPAAEAFEAIVDDRSDIGVMGDAWNIGSDGVVEILWPRDPETDIASDNVHTRSIVAKLSVHDSVMLFMGDAERDIEEALLANDDLLLPSVDVLKVGHHGSDTSTSQAFLDVVTPATAIISVGEENIYEHPSPFVLGRLTSMGALVLRTDQNGTVRFDF